MTSNGAENPCRYTPEARIHALLDQLKQLGKLIGCRHTILKSLYRASRTDPWPTNTAELTVIP